MQVGIKNGGDGVRCWNAQAVTAYADEVNRREQQVAQANPDVTVLSGRLVCYGCEVMEYDYGVKCTATLTRTRYAVSGEIEPRAEDAKGSLLEIPGLLGRAPAEIEAEAQSAELASSGSGAGNVTPAAGATTGATTSGSSRSDAKRGGLRGLFNR